MESKDELREKINRVIQDNTPCYRDLFGVEGGCVYDTGCIKCPDYFNVRQDIVNQVMNLLAGYRLPPELTVIERKNDPDETPKGWTQHEKEDYIIGYVIGYEDGAKAQLAHDRKTLEG